jgi:hypothetical protein
MGSMPQSSNQWLHDDVGGQMSLVNRPAGKTIVQGFHRFSYLIAALEARTGVTKRLWSK